MSNIVSGDLSVDSRGVVRFVNDFDFKEIKRFYQIENHKVGFIRAWHGHKNESKYVYVARGAALVGVANLDTEDVESFVLSDEKPRILRIPPNHANGFMTLKKDTIMVFFSSSTIDESKEDDIRYPYDKWNIWDIKNE